MFLFKASRIGAHANGNVMGAQTIRDRSQLIFAADIAGIDADFVRAVLYGEHREFCRKVDVRHERQRYFIADRPNGARVRFVAHGDAHDLAARRGESSDLRGGLFRVARRRGSHRLDLYCSVA